MPNNPNIIDIPTICEDLAEDIGIQLGDGCIGIFKDGKLKNGAPRYRKSIEICGNKTEDRPYLIEHVRSLKRKLYGDNFSIQIIENRNAGTVVLVMKSVKLFDFYKSIGLPIGPKTHAKMPEIINSIPLRRAFLRGLTDTDGCLCFRINGKYRCPVIRLAMKSTELARDVCKALDENELTYSWMRDSKRHDKRTGNTHTINDIYIAGNKNLEKWMKLIGFNNPVHRSKYILYKELGMCLKHTCLEERLRLIKENDLNMKN